MSYARWSCEGSNVYVYATGPEGPPWVLVCCGCSIPPAGSRSFDTVEQMTAHLRDHEAAGHVVPPSTYTEMETDRKEGLLR